MLSTIIEIEVGKLIFSAVALLIVGIGYSNELIDKKAAALTSLLALYFIFLFPFYWFSSLLILYITTSFATKQKSRWKQVFHRKGRKIKNLLSNLAPSLFFSAIYLIEPEPYFYLAFLCSAACACSDTVASEIGQLSGKKPRLITTLEEVKTGIDGGISALGLSAAALGAVLTAYPALWMQPEIFAFRFFIIGSIIGFIGCNIDSFVGAKWELRGKVNNEITNLVATSSSAILGLLVWILVF